MSTIAAFGASAALAAPNPTVDHNWIATSYPASWSTATSWSPNIAGGPDSVGIYVRINTNISSNGTIALFNTGDAGDGTKTVGRLDIADSALSGGSFNRFVIGAGTASGVLNFDGNGGPAQLNQLTTGLNNQITAPVTLSSDLDITNGNGNALELNGAITASSTQFITVKGGTAQFGSSIAATGSAITLRLGDTSGSLDASILGVARTYSNDVIVQSGNSGTSKLGNSGNTASVFSGLVSLNRSLTVSAVGTGSVNLSGAAGGSALTGSGNVTVTSATPASNTVTFGGSNSGFTGGVAVQSGTLRVSNAAALSSANTVSVDSLNGATFSLSTTASVAVDQTIAGLNDGTNGGGTVTNNSSATRTLTLAGSGSYSFSGTITAATPSRLSLAKSGSGTQALSGSNTYAGGTTVSAGTLLVNNASGSGTGTGAVSVTGGTLGGNGFITTAGNAGVTVAASAKLAPGASAGVLTLDLGSGVLNISGAVTAGNSQSLLFELDTLLGTNDKVVLSNASSTLNIGGGVLEFDDFAFTDLGGLETGVYTLFDTSAAVTGSFGSVLTGSLGVGKTGTLSFGDGGRDVVLTVAVPEPATFGLMIGALGLFARRRPRRG